MIAIQGRAARRDRRCNCPALPTPSGRETSSAPRRCSNGSSWSEARRRRARRCSPTRRHRSPSGRRRHRRFRSRLPATRRYYLVRSVADITGRDLRTARPILDETQPARRRVLADAGRRRDVRAADRRQRRTPSRHHARRTRAVRAAIEMRIDGGEGTSAGRLLQQEAADLSLVLRAGALPASMTYLGGRLCRTITRQRVDPLRHRRVAGRPRA